MQCAPWFQQGQHLVKPPGSAGEGFAPGSEVGFPSQTPEKFQRDSGCGIQPPAPIPKLLSFARAWFLNLPGFLLRRGVHKLEQVVSVMPGFRRQMGLLRQSMQGNGVVPWRSSS